jgi:hypothetical protein
MREDSCEVFSSVDCKSIPMGDEEDARELREADSVEPEVERRVALEVASDLVALDGNADAELVEVCNCRRPGGQRAGRCRCEFGAEIVRIVDDRSVGEREMMLRVAVRTGENCLPLG